jgi:hypothetical protein
MHDGFITPPASRRAERPAPFDDALFVAALRVLHDTLDALPLTAGTHPRGHGEHFAGGVRALSVDCRRAGVPVEKLIIALKEAWASTPELRIRLGEAGPDALTAMVTASIETYFLVDPDARAG